MPLPDLIANAISSKLALWDALDALEKQLNNDIPPELTEMIEHYATAANAPSNLKLQQMGTEICVNLNLPTN